MLARRLLTWTNPVGTSMGPRPAGIVRHGVQLDDVGVGDDFGLPVPAALDFGCRALCEGDQGVCAGDEHIQVCVVRRGGLMVGIAQVVDGVDQRLAVPAKGGDGFLQRGRFLRIKTEVDVEHVE